MNTKIIFIVIALIILGLGFMLFLPKKQEKSEINTDTLNNTNQVNPEGETKMNSQQQVPSSKTYSEYPKTVIDENKKYTAVLSTSKGGITLELFAQEVPQTVNNFVFLAGEGFYNGTKFHRIIKGFMIQGGDPLGNGSGDPGYKFADEKVTRDYQRGIIAMANSGPNTNGSQFFIMHADYDLPKNYTIFGQVTAGLDILDLIANTPVVANPFGEVSQPTEDVVILKIQVNES